MRPGFKDLVAYCRRQGHRLVIVSNGLDFYIKAILEDIGERDIEVFAARTRFHPDGIKVQYIGPDGRYLDSNFKKAYTDFFLREGYRITYIGNGMSDILPASQCHRIFATGDMLVRCRKLGLKCIPFAGFGEVIRGLEPG